MGTKAGSQKSILRNDGDSLEGVDLICESATLGDRAGCGFCSTLETASLFEGALVACLGSLGVGTDEAEGVI